MKIKIENIEIQEDGNEKWLACCDLIIDGETVRCCEINSIGHKAVSEMFRSVSDVVCEYYSESEY